MLRFAFGLSAFYLGCYPFAVQRFSWIAWFHPRGGIIGLVLFLALAIGLIWWGRGPTGRGRHPSASSDRLPESRDGRVEAVFGGWLLLLMPPIWWMVSVWAA